MFNSPKWLLFAIITFGLIHTMSFIMDTGTMTGLDTNSTHLGGFFGLASTMSRVLTFNYSYLDGSFYLLKFILATIQGVFIFFALKEVLDYGRGR